MKSIWIISLLFAQTFRHYDYLGGGHQTEVTIDEFAINNDKQLAAAARFLAQATMGTDWAMIEQTAAMGYDAWLEEQFALPVSSAKATSQTHAQRYREGEEVDQQFDGKFFFGSAWMQNQLHAPDVLRQLFAFGLSQYLVFSNANSDLFEDYGMYSAH